VIRILVGNKCDLEHKRQVSFDQGKELARQYNVSKFLETSAKDTVNIDELFTSTTQLFLEKQVNVPGKGGNIKDKNLSSGAIALNNNSNNNNNNDSSCC
jgi:GTPase SAR1 family protein